MHIGQLAKLAHVPIDTVRYYERHGILPAPAREGSGYRRYEPHDVRRLHFVRRAKALGFTLGEIQELLALCAPRHGDMGAIKAAASAKLTDVEHRLAELTRVRDGLRTLVQACPGHGDLDCCPIVAALSREDA